MIQIPQPCHKKWENLSGDDQQRFCTSCEKYVYNLNGLSSSDLNDLMERESKVCAIITTKKQSVSLTTKLRLALVGIGLFITNVFGQLDSIQIKGKVNDVNGFPIMDSKITLKNFPIESFSNNNGEFVLNVPKNLKTYVLEVKDDKNKIEILYKEEELTQQIIIPLEHPDEIIIGEIIYKPTIKQRVINTITWPYRKIRQTFFNN